MAAKDMLLYSIEVDRAFIKEEEVLHIFNTSDTEDTRPYEIIMYV